MANILEKITAKKREELDLDKAQISFDAIFEQAKNSPTQVSFYDALEVKDGRPAVIAELKKASPSMGLIRENFEPVELAKMLEMGGASALSVLTEKNFFLGSKENLLKAKATVKIPILRKDFIFDEYQICQAKVWGASAVLLIKAMLSDEDLTRFINFAHSLNLDALVETHNADEIECALNCGAKIVGVNSRNLKNFEMDFTLFEKLLAKIPQGVKAVAESGISDPNSLKKAAEFGASAALIGTALMQKENPQKELERLLGRA